MYIESVWYKFYTYAESYILDKTTKNAENMREKKEETNTIK